MMLTSKILGYHVSIIIGVCLYFSHFTRAEVKSESACHSSSTATCNYIELECEQGSRIRILSMKYGVKESKCTNSRKRCLDPNRDGCCAYNTEDCMEYYSDLHAYNLFKECSGKQSCGPLPVPNSILTSCDGKASTYVHVTYECLPVNNEVKFCRVGNYSNIAGPQLSVVFDQSGESSTTPANCSCFITANSSDVNVDYVDIRMFKDHTGTPGSDCSSVELTSVPFDNFNTQCVNSKNEDDNFKYGHLTTSTFIEMKLINLYNNGIGDAPQFIWLQITGNDQSDVNVQCFKHVNHQTTPIPPFTTFPPSTTPEDNSNSTKSPVSTDDDSNTGAIVAGVLVSVILLAVIGAVIIFLVCRRHGYPCKKKQKRAAPNKYTDRPDIENSVENSEYAEIGFVPDVTNMEPNYDQVYEPKPKKDSHEANGHTYQNVGNNGTLQKKQPKSTKSPFGKLKTHTDRLISFFRTQTENDFPQVTKREREDSAGSYDHLRPISANSNVHVEITPPVDESKHMYSHTSDESVKKQVALKQEIDKSNKTAKASPIIEKRKDIPDEEINAFHVGDAYIEFQFGAVDENHPNLVKSPKDNVEGERPAPPTRPPPSPRSAAKLEKIPTPKASPHQVRQGLTAQNEPRSKSPNCLSPSYTNHDNSPNYDYAAGEHVRPRSASPRGSDVSDLSSEHSYKILEPQQQQEVYDYADVSDDDLAGKIDGYTSGSIYEDVDKNIRAESIRKHRSATDVPMENNEYLEPVTSRPRAISSPGESPGYKNKDENVKPKSAASLLKRELKEKAQQKKQDRSKEIKSNSNFKDTKKKQNDESEMIKSDNVETKDYQKVDGVKGVLKMAKLFESKESDSDTSRQSSPRDLQFSDIPNNKKKSSSNA